jgi:D-beta-D-heptose 7-phosphate kinase / D-beta-D-heptose 1-phosphate adenosyltransferase
VTPDPTPAGRLREIILGVPAVHLWVVGDVILDEYLVGDISRISPEAPVPVMKVQEQQLRLGGATNVARQVALLGGRVSLCGAVGTDAAGDAVLAACAESGIDTRAVARVDGVPTTRKVRVLGRGQQIVRLDWEDTRPCPSPLAAEMVARLRSGPPPDVIVISDYGKGFLIPETLAAVFQFGRERGVEVLVDPKRSDFEAYRGATLIKPNLAEVSHAVGRSLGAARTAEIVAAAAELTERCGLAAMVVTLGDRGILVVPRDAEPREIRAQRREVFDVTGAGDTAMAVLACGLAAGGTLVESAELANLAAGIVVGEVGAAAVAPAELLAAIEVRRQARVLDRRGLVAQVEAWRLRGLRVVFTNGCFDLLHVGHLELLREAASLGDVLVLGINSDDSVRRLKGGDRPLTSEDERATLLAALDCVDAVTIFDEDTPLALLRAVRPDVLVKGGDYALDEVVGRELVESYGGRVELVPILPERSTSRLVERIRKKTAV